jgi:hypothetical protein
MAENAAAIKELLFGLAFIFGLAFLLSKVPPPPPKQQQ